MVIDPPRIEPFKTLPPVVASIAGGVPLRVLALGDSITWGYNDPTENSYRRDLACLLWTRGNPIAMIGSIKHGNWDNNEVDAFIYHTIDDILRAGTGSLTLDREQKPNIITLHAGSVNFVLKKNVTDAPQRLGNLIDFITDENPDALLVVSQLIPCLNPNATSHMDWYNGEMPKIVAARARKGKKVVMASMKGLTPRHVPDHAHPDEEGSRIMAQRFYDAIVESGKIGLISPPVGPFEDRGSGAPNEDGTCNELVGGGGRQWYHSEL